MRERLQLRRSAIFLRPRLNNLQKDHRTYEIIIYKICIMNISLLGYTFNVQLLILIGVVYLILVGHTVCGCCNWGLLREGLENAVSDASLNGTTSKLSENGANGNGSNMNMLLAQMMRQQMKNGGNGSAELPTQVSSEDTSAPVAGGGTLSAKAKDASAKSGDKLVTKEGFDSRPANYGKNASSVNTASWFQKKDGNDRLAKGSQPVPLPEGEMLLFKTTPFKPECCPNTYSTSSGCACMSGEQYNYLKLRGHNNVPYSTF